jgi:tripartite-type tricarboxylate transporter receptor subunit TctC
MANIRYCTSFFRFFVLGIFFSCLTAISFAPVYAAYPEKSLSLVSPFQPGGASDVLARVIVKPLSEALGQAVIIESKPGAAANIGMQYVARSSPDGYTLLLVSSNLVINPNLYANPGYDAIKDFAPIIMPAGSPNLILVHPSFPAKNIQEFFFQSLLHVTNR